jgi:diguanylate cyclase (GGDEF)-like protein
MERLNRGNGVAGREILIVDDSPTQAVLLQHMLEQHGFAVSIATNGREALSRIDGGIHSLVISDIIMPGMDGFELCRRIKDDERSKDVPVILLTSLSDPLDVIKGLKCGADNFLTKPCDENLLISLIQYIFANVNLGDQEQNQFGVEVILAGEKHFIKSDPIRMLNFLFYSYEAAIQKNRELTKVWDELRQLSTHDILTGIYNRTYFEEEIVRLSLGRQFPVSILTADVDGLKRVNDSLGHEAGDRLLRLAAGALSGAFRAGDVVARTGGDEFRVLLPGADAHVVVEAMERIRKSLEDINRTEVEFTVSISLGAATAQTAKELSTALKVSDERMYQDKFTRKGKVGGSVS